MPPKPPSPELLAWIESRPPNIREVARRFPPGCYRPLGCHGHYQLYSYEEADDGSVSLKIVHGADSTLPGYIVAGLQPEELEPCGCGQWKPASPGQVQETAAVLRHLHSAGDDHEDHEHGP